jgi:glutathione S-transferase
VLESFAILDYLEARFPYPSLLPSNPSAIAQTRMVQMVVANELIPKLPLLVSEADATPDPATMLPVESVLMFLAEQLGTADFFGGDRLSLADITAGAAVPLVRRLGYPLGEDTALARWCNRLMERSAWQETEPSEAALEIWKRWILAMVKRRQRQIKV